jgi:hypothetical protein
MPRIFRGNCHREKQLANTAHDRAERVVPNFAPNFGQRRVEVAREPPPAQLAGNYECHTQPIIVRLEFRVRGVDARAVGRPSRAMRIILAFRQVHDQTGAVSYIGDLTRLQRLVRPGLPVFQ